MAVTENFYTGNGSTTSFSLTFEYLEEDDVKVTLNEVITTAYSFANATTILFNTQTLTNSFDCMHTTSDSYLLLMALYLLLLVELQLTS